MIFKTNRHEPNLYNILLSLSRNIFFYSKTKLPDTFETRIYLMFFHFSILMIISKKKGLKFDQKSYDLFFHNIEYNLRELGFGDVSVNKKMKELNKILYDILLKIEVKNDDNEFKINSFLLDKYLRPLKNEQNTKYTLLSDYFIKFFDFCFELRLENMIEGCNKFKY